MTVIFDTQTQPISELPYAVFGLAPLLALAVSGAARRHWRWFAGIAVVLVALAAGVPLWDHARLKKLADVQVTRGPLLGVWRKTVATRDWTKSNLSYKRTTTEGFWVGAEGFRYLLRSGLSTASFSNAGDLDLKPYEGRIAEVRWFVDPASQGERRILRLAVEDPPRPEAGVAKTDDFGGFWATFSGAAARGDAAAVRQLTRFPFMLGGNDVSREQFDTLWTGLFTPSIRACLAKAAPSAEGALMEALCDGTIFLFAKDGDGWKFTEIGADD